MSRLPSMNVLLIGPLPSPVNGCSYANATFLEGAIAAGHNCRFINTSGGEISSKQGQRFSFGKAIHFFSVYFEFWKIFLSDVVYLTPGQTFFGLLKYAPFIILCRLSRRPYVIHVHGGHLGKQYASLFGAKRYIFRFLIEGAAAGIVLSKSLSGIFEGLLSAEKVHVLGNFVSSDLLMKRECLKFDDIPRILYLSNLMRGKGILDFLDALILIKSHGLRFQAVVAGIMEKEVEVEVRERFEILNKELVYLGSISGDEKIKTLMDANIFILPTYYQMEGQPISILEALASGNIIISTAHAGIPDIISHENGILVPIKNAQAIADSVFEISEDLKSNVAKFSANNIAYAKAMFSVDQFVGGLLKILSSARTS